MRICNTIKQWKSMRKTTPTSVTKMCCCWLNCKAIDTKFYQFIKKYVCISSNEQLLRYIKVLSLAGQIACNLFDQMYILLWPIRLAVGKYTYIKYFPVAYSQFWMVWSNLKGNGVNSTVSGLPSSGNPVAESSQRKCFL